MRDQVHPQRAGRSLAERAFARLFLKAATVESHAILAPRFHLVTLAGSALKGVKWNPGEVIQIGMGAFVARTFTPISWNAEAGSTSFLGFESTHGPGSDWLASMKPGDTCEFFGPRSAIGLHRSAAPRFLFGDETSFGLALAAKQQCDDPTICVFEVNSPPDARKALEATELYDATLLERREDDSHLEEAASRLVDISKDCKTFILSGKASSIQRMRQTLKKLAVPSSRIFVKAHWAPGKTGLD